MAWTQSLLRNGTLTSATIITSLCDDYHASSTSRIIRKRFKRSLSSPSPLTGEGLGRG
jgi:hypothetical protein